MLPFDFSLALAVWPLSRIPCGQISLVDVFLLASLYTLRNVAGGLSAIEVSKTSLAFAKRFVEFGHGLGAGCPPGGKSLLETSGFMLFSSSRCI